MEGDQAALPDLSLGDQMDKDELSLSLEGVSEGTGEERTDDVSSIVEDDPNGTNISLDDDLGDKADQDLNSSVAVAARIEEENSVDPFDDELEKLLVGGGSGATGQQAANGTTNENGESVERREQEESNLEEVPMEEELFLDVNNASNASAAAQANEGGRAEAQQPTSMITETAVAAANEKDDDDELADLLSDLEGGDEEKSKRPTKEDDDFDLGEEEGEGEEGAGGEKKDETRAALLESIFGGDDDDDDDLGALLNEDAGGFVEDEKKSGRKKKSGGKRGKRKADSEDSDIEKKTKRRLEEILQQKDEKEKKKQQRGSKKRRQSHADAEFDEGGEEDEEVSTKKRRRRASAGDDAPKRKRRSKKVDADEEGGEGGEGDGVEKSDFDTVVEQMKKSNRRRKNPLSREQIDQMVEALLNKMGDAVDADIRAIQEKSPAFAKVKLLPEVVAMLQKVHMQESFVEGGGLRAVKQWLEPLSDGSLPNYNIRSSLLSILPKLHIESDHLRESGLGKVVMFLWKSPKETKENKIIAQELIQTWSRPIFQLSLNYKEHADHERKQLQRQDSYRRSSSSQSLNTSQTDDSLDSIVGSRSSGTAQKEEFSYHARIPQPADKDYVHRPVSQVEMPIQPVGKALSKQKLFDRRLTELKVKRKGRSITAQSRAAKLSVEGRNLHI